MPKTVIEKYLTQLAEPEASLALDLIKNSYYESCSILPIAGETQSTFNRCLKSISLALSEKHLLILVINERQNSEAEIKFLNQQLLQFLQAYVGISKQNYSDYLDLLIINRSEQTMPLPAKQGVGLARKIGADIALKLYQLGRLKKPIVYSLDTDTILPLDYIKRIHHPSAVELIPNQRLFQNDAKPIAFIYPFNHFTIDHSLGSASKHYDSYLKDCEKKLRFANSPYAYTSLGSCLAFDLLAYAKIQGFPKLLALEDFYLLNKLAKIGPIACLQGEVIQIEGRASLRNPLGTGVCIHQHVKTQKSISFDPVKAYLSLKDFIEWMENWAFSGKTHPLKSLNDCLLNKDNRDQIEKNKILSTYKKLNIEQNLLKIFSQNHGLKTRLYLAHCYFDALKTRQWIHGVA